MGRYFTRPRAIHWIEDEHAMPEPGRVEQLSVPDHEATDTGLLDHRGDAIMRAPNAMGFIWEGE